MAQQAPDTITTNRIMQFLGKHDYTHYLENGYPIVEIAYFSPETGQSGISRIALLSVRHCLNTLGY